MILVIQNDGRVPPGLLGERLRQMGVEYVLLRLDEGERLPRPEAVEATIVLGGYMGVHEEQDYPFLKDLKAFIRRIAALGSPLLGICLGGQLLAEVLGAKVTPRFRGEKGMRTVHLSAAGRSDPFFAGVDPVFVSFQWHNDSFDLPPGAVHLAQSKCCPGQAFRLGHAWGLQFHPEVDSQIVAAWTAPVDAQEGFLIQFRDRESSHRSLAFCLTDNFLRIVATAREPDRGSSLTSCSASM